MVSQARCVSLIEGVRERTYNILAGEIITGRWRWRGAKGTLVSSHLLKERLETGIVFPLELVDVESSKGLRRNLVSY
jgi:hypothetical protein